MVEVKKGGGSHAPWLVGQRAPDEATVPPGVEGVALDQELLQAVGCRARRSIRHGDAELSTAAVASTLAGPGELGRALLEVRAGAAIGEAEGDSRGRHGEETVGVKGAEPDAGASVWSRDLRSHVHLAE